MKTVKQYYEDFKYLIDPKYGSWQYYLPQDMADIWDDLSIEAKVIAYLNAKQKYRDEKHHEELYHE